MIEIRCPGCERKLKIQDSAAGQARACPACGQRFRVPATPSKQDDRPARTGIRPSESGKSSRANCSSSASQGRPTTPARRPLPPQEEEEAYEELEIVSSKPQAKKEEDEAPVRPSKKTAQLRRSRGDERESVGRKTQRLRRDDADDDDRPRGRSKIREDDDEEEEDRLRRRPSSRDDDDQERKPKRRRKTKKAYLKEPPSSIDPFIFIIIGLACVWLIMTASAFMVPFMGALLGALGVLVSIAARIWILVIAHRAGDLRNCLVIPFYELYFIIASIGETWKTAVVYLIGIIMLITGLILWPHGIIHDDGRAPAGFHQNHWENPDDDDW